MKTRELTIRLSRKISVEMTVIRPSALVFFQFPAWGNLRFFTFFFRAPSFDHRIKPVLIINTLSHTPRLYLFTLYLLYMCLGILPELIRVCMEIARFLESLFLFFFVFFFEARGHCAWTLHVDIRSSRG